jgi:hypothetical protein
MAAAAYTTDLTLINACDNNATPTAWTNLGTGADATETDYFIQSTACISKPFNITAGGLYTDFGSNISFATGDCYWLWVYFAAPNALKTEALGGLQALVGSAAGAYELWNVLGSDYYTYGGWRCIPVDITQVTRDAVVGAPAGTYRIFGVYCNTTVGIGKGNPLGIDVIRKGRGEARFSGGDLANGYATFEGFSTQNDNQANRWGLCQFDDGSFRVQGKFVFGSGAAVDFRDSNRSIIINNIRKVSSDFNRFEIQNAGSRVDWSTINITSLGTVARGNFECVADADLNMDGCSFTDMGTFIFKPASSIVGTTFRRTGQITLGGGTMSGCLMTNDRDPIALSCGSSVAGLSDTEFVSDGTGHAIEITSGTSHTLSGLIFSGYAASNGSTGNETLFVNIASGSVTINADSAISYRTAGATVTVVVGQKTLTLTGLVSGSDVVFLEAGTSTVIESIDQNIGSTYAFSYSTPRSVDIGVIKPGYIVNYTRNFALPTSNASLPIAQTIDRSYT